MTTSSANWYWICLAYHQANKDKRPQLCMDCVDEPLVAVLAHNFGLAKTHKPSCLRLVTRDDGSKWYIAIIVGPWPTKERAQAFASAMGEAGVDAHDENAQCDAAVEILDTFVDKRSVHCFTQRAARSPQEEMQILPPSLRTIYETMYHRSSSGGGSDPLKGET